MKQVLTRKQFSWGAFSSFVNEV